MTKLIRLNCHTPEESAARYERGKRLFSDAQIINWAALRSQRWVVFVNNGFTSAVVMSEGMRSGICSCEDFKKHGKTCKHIYAAVLKINYAREHVDEFKRKKINARALQMVKNSLAELAAEETQKVLEVKTKLDLHLDRLVSTERKIEFVPDIEEILR